MSQPSQDEEPLTPAEVQLIRRLEPPQHGADFWLKLTRNHPDLATGLDLRPPSPAPSSLSLSSELSSRSELSLSSEPLMSSELNQPDLPTSASAPSKRPGQRSFLAAVVLSLALMVGFVVLFVSAGPNDFVARIDPAGDNSQAAATVRMSATDMIKRGDGGVTDNGWRLWGDGHIEQWVVLAEGDYRVSITAIGHSTSDRHKPEMTIRLDRVPVGRTLVELEDFRSYQFQITATEGTHLLAVAFSNDPNKPALDVDLEVGFVEIEPLP